MGCYDLSYKMPAKAPQVKAARAQVCWWAIWCVSFMAYGLIMLETCQMAGLIMGASVVEFIHMTKFRSSFAARTDEEVAETCYDEDGDNDFSPEELWKERMSSYCCNEELFIIYLIITILQVLAAFSGLCDDVGIVSAMAVQACVNLGRMTIYCVSCVVYGS